MERLRTNPTHKGHSHSGGDSNNNSETYLKLQQLQTQYDILVSQSSSKGQVYKQMEEQIEGYSTKVKDLRRALEELRYEKEQVDIKAERSDDLENVATELRRANRSLEDKIARLCEAPFISDAFGQQESRLRFEDVAKEREDYLAKVNHLQEAVRTHFSALTSLKQHAAQLREEKEAAERRAEEMALKLQESEADSSVINDKLRLYSGDGDVDVEQLERALTLVKRRGEAVGKLPFLEDPDGDATMTVPVLKRKLEEVQIMNLKLTEEVERFESMLKLQSGINRDLHKELEVVVHRRDADKQVHVRRADEAEQLSKKRLDKVASLEAQLKQLVYDISRRPGSSRGAGGHAVAKDPSKANDGIDSRSSAFEASTVASDAGNALLNELIEEGGGELAPDRNLMEVWVKGANIVSNTVPSSSSTLCVVEFFDFQSQPTSLERGNKPQWDFAATYNIVVDDFLLRCLATDTVTIELHSVAQGDNMLMARCTIPLASLLKSKPCIQLHQHPMISVRTGEILAYLDVELRLALPVSELFRLFLERHPNERDFIKETGKQLMNDATASAARAQHATSDINAAAQEDSSRLYNDLEIAIIAAKGIPLSKNGKKPAAYVHFQFLGYPEIITPVVPGTCDPTFNLRWSFPMVTDDSKLRLLRRSKLHLTLLDMNGEEITDDDSEGLVGEVFLNLEEISDGNNFHDVFAVKDSGNNKICDLEIGMRWKHTFRQQRDLGPRALSGVEVETLISAFSSSMGTEGTVVDYRSFCRFVDPPVEVRRVMDRLRNYAQRIAESEGRSGREIFKVLFEDNRDIDPDTFINKMELTNMDVLPADFARLFNFIDMDEDNLITLDQILAVLNLDELVTVPQSLNDKLRERARDMQSRGMSALSLFELADQWGANGLVTRMEFKEVLKKMGFQLVDEPDAEALMNFKYSTITEGGRNIDASNNNNDKDVLNDTLNSNDDVLIANEGADGVERGAMHGRFATEDAKEQRQIFDERTKEAAAQRAKALGDAKNAASTNDGNGDRTVVTGKNLLRTAPAGSSAQTPAQLASDPFGNDTGHHKAGITTAGKDRKADTLDRAQVDKSATAVQKTVRGHLSRNTSDDVPPLSVDTASVVGEAEGGDKHVVDIINAEMTIRNCLKNLRGVAPEPNLIAGFARVDSKRSGYVNRQQFAHTMKQFDVIKLPGAQLRACMDFFDASAGKDGSKIDYEAFAALVRHRQPTMLPSVSRLETIVLAPDASQSMKAYDSMANGQIKRADMLRALSNLGYHDMGSSALLGILELFETKLEGQVNYGNFVEFVRENGLCVQLDRAAAEIFALATKQSLSSHAKDIRAQGANVDESGCRDVFAKIDTQLRGKFTAIQLTAFLSEYDIKSPPEVVNGLIACMDTSARGEVTSSDFMAWIKNLPFVERQGSSMYSTPSLAEIQRKANAYLLAVAKSASVGGSPTLEEVSNCFSVYDWSKNQHQMGAVGRGIFLHACKRAGFCFTLGELRTIASEFAVGDNSGRIRYRKFLEWATPESGNGNTGSGSIDRAKTERGNPAPTLIKFLEKRLQSGIDLLSVFGRYDKTKVGRVTADECCAVFADLGISTVTQKEALEMADRYSAATGNYVMYRQVVQDLLRHMDEVTGASNVDVVDVVKAALQRSRVDLRRLRDIFELYDRKSSGRVPEEDLGIIFEEAHVRLKRQELESIGDKYCVSGGVQGSGLVTYGPLFNALESAMEGNALNNPNAHVSPELATKLRALFEELILKGKDFYEEFSRADDHTGALLQSSFRDVLQDRLHSGLSTRDLNGLEKAYRDTHDPRKVNYARVIRDFHPRFFVQGSPRSGEDAYTQAEVLRNKIRRKCDYTTPGELKKVFPHFKRSRDAYGVSLKDLAAAMRDLNMVVAPDHEREIFDFINLSGGQEFTYTDFCVFVRDPMHADVAWKLRRLMARNRIGDGELTNALADQDRTGSNKVTFSDFEKALRYCNIELSVADVSRLVLRFDSEETKRIDIKLFAQFLRGQPADVPAGSMARTATGEEGETRAWEAVRKRIIDKLEIGLTQNEVFAYFDDERRGTLDVGGLQHGSREIGAEMGRGDARSTFRRMMQLAGGPVDRESFFEAFQIDLRTDVRPKNSARDRYDERDMDRGDRDRGRDRDDAPRSARDSARGVDSDLYSAFKDKISRHSDVRDGITLPQDLLRRALERAAIKREGKLTQRELERALTSLECPPTPRELLKIFQHLDPNLSDYLSVNALLDAMYPASNSGSARRGRDSPRDTSRERSSPRGSTAVAAAVFRRRPDLAEDVMSRLSDKQHIDDLLQSCKKADRYDAGQLERSEFAKCMYRSGVELPKAVERDLVDSLGEGQSGINYQDFIDSCRAELEKGDITDDIILLLQKRISRDMKHGGDVNAIFAKMDRNGDGELDIDEIEEALDKVGIPLTREESKRIVQKFSIRGNTIKYKAFILALNPESIGAGDVVTLLLDRVKRKVEERAGSAANAMREIKETFADIDVDNSGTISEAELRNAMRKLRVEMDRDDISVIFKRYASTHGRGEMDYDDFLRMLDFAGTNATAPSSARDGRDSARSAGSRASGSGRKPSFAAIQKIVDEVRAQIEDYLGDGAGAASRIKEVFADIDRNNDGQIDQHEFIKALKMLRANLSMADVDIVYDYYDADSNGGLDYDEFIRLLGFETSSARNRRQNEERKV
eukprot:GSChrysophyteH2.ASY1.ANO1.454.1 assembled CDS